MPGMSASALKVPVSSGPSEDILRHVPSSAFITYSVENFCEELEQSTIASSANTVSCTRYRDKSGVHHRFLILHVQHDGTLGFYIRLDRRPSREGSVFHFLRNSSTDTAKDTVSDLLCAVSWMSHHGDSR